MKLKKMVLKATPYQMRVRILVALCIVMIVLPLIFFAVQPAQASDGAPPYDRTSGKCMLKRNAPLYSEIGGFRLATATVYKTSVSYSQRGRGWLLVSRTIGGATIAGWTQEKNCK